MALRPCYTCGLPSPDAVCPRHSKPSTAYRPHRDRGPYRSSEWRKLRLLVLEASDWTCSYCGSPANTVDHIIPWSKGGTTSLENLAACCYRCNASKKDRLQWRP